MFVRGVDLQEVREIERGADAIRVTFKDGNRRFIEGEEGLEVWNSWALERRLMEKSDECKS